MRLHCGRCRVAPRNAGILRRLPSCLSPRLSHPFLGLTREDRGLRGKRKAWVSILGLGRVRVFPWGDRVRLVDGGCGWQRLGGSRRVRRGPFAWAMSAHVPNSSGSGR